jgi:pimeloyl-ACP methyl ester carboxylesterase
MSAMPDREQLTVQGSPVGCLRRSGDGPLFVLLHGNPDTKEIWEPVADLLGSAAPDLSLVAPDLPGFGDTAAPPGFPFDLDALAGWTRALLDELGSTPQHLVGHDIGGIYALACAVRHPERVASLTLMNTLFFADYRWHFWGRVWRTPLLGELSFLLAPRWLWMRELRRGTHGRYPEDLARAGYTGMRSRQTRQGVLALYRNLDPERFAPWEQSLIASPIPRRVVWGLEDPYIPARFADRLGGEVRRLEGVGHWPMIEAPEVVADEALTLIRSAGSPSSGA